ncbi:MAG: alpha/beta hydrolase [Lachnospiraceae bacterium]|nr:alpha/beta hydrolase [Lachnospiraceae bacterium]
MKEFFIDSDGISLHAKLDFPAGVESGPLCILIPGFTGHMEEDHIVAARDAINDARVIVLRAEMYGHGGSGGKFRDHTLYKWVTNALSVVKYAKGLPFVTDLYLCGHSQGGLLTMLVGGMCSDDLRAIIPMSPAWMIPDYCREGRIHEILFDPKHIPEKIQSDEWELSGDYIRVAQTLHPEDEIARYEGPVYLIHGDIDQAVPYACSEKALKLYKNARLITIHGGDHCFVGHLDEMSDALRDFFRTSLS